MSEKSGVCAICGGTAPAVDLLDCALCGRRFHFPAGGSTCGVVAPNPASGNGC